MRIKRNAQEDRNMCPSKKSAEAHLAMMQLHQLRDCYRQGWKPSYAFKAYAICREGTAFRVRETRSDDKFLSFPTMELAVYFLDRFKALIHLADDLI